MIPGYIVNRCREISEKITLKTGLDSLIVENGVLNLSSIVEEIQDRALEELFIQHLIEVKDLMRQKKGVFVDLRYEVLRAGVFKCIVHASEEDKSLFIHELINAMGLSLRERQTIKTINNAISFEHNFIVTDEVLQSYIRSSISDKMSIIHSFLEEKIEEGVISSYVVSNYLVSFSFPPSENLSSDCKLSIRSELSRILEENGISDFDRNLYDRYVAQGKFYGIEKNNISFGFILSKTKGVLSLMGAVIEEDLVQDLGSLEMASNTISNNSFIDCDYITNNIEEISEGIEDHIYLFQDQR